MSCAYPASIIPMVSLAVTGNIFFRILIFIIPGVMLNEQWFFL
jgi:hypothetical protein